MYSYSSSYQKRFSSRWINIHFWCYLNHTVHWSVRIKLKALFVTLKTKKNQRPIELWLRRFQTFCFRTGSDKYKFTSNHAEVISGLDNAYKLSLLLPPHPFRHFACSDTAETSQARVSVLSLILHRINISILSRDSLMKLQNSTQLAASLTRHPTRNAGSQITLSLERSKQSKNHHKIHSSFPSRFWNP